MIDHVVADVVVDHVDAVVVAIANSKRRLPRLKAMLTLSTSIGNLTRVMTISMHPPARHVRQICRPRRNHACPLTTKMASSAVAHAVHAAAANDNCCRSTMWIAAEPPVHRKLPAHSHHAMTIHLRIDHADARKRADASVAPAVNRLAVNPLAENRLAERLPVAIDLAVIPLAVIPRDATRAGLIEPLARHVADPKNQPPARSLARKPGGPKVSVATTTLSSLMTTMQTVSAAA